MAKSKEKVYDEMDIYDSEYPSCCGIQVMSGLLADTYAPPPKPVKQGYESPENFAWRLKNWEEKTKNYKGLTKEGLFKDFLKQVTDRRYCRHIQIVFVKRRKGSKEGDMPAGFKEFLEENGWYTIDEFVNPNHGNLLCVMGKTYRNTKKSKNNVW